MTLGDMSLDGQQIEAVVACEDIQLVLASAGSGKTMSLLAKIEYLVRKLKIAPAQILVVSFTKKTVAELIERCAIKNVDIQTFHSLGNKILKTVSTIEQGTRSLVDDAELSHFLRRKVIDHCRENDDFARIFNDFVLFYFACPKSPGATNSFREKIIFNRLYLRSALICERASLNKDEQLIANLLAIHDIKYERHQQCYRTRVKYRPSFSFCDEYYIDAVDISKGGASFRGRQYLKEIKWRREFHKRNHSKYFEAKSYF